MKTSPTSIKRCGVNLCGGDRFLSNSIYLVTMFRKFDKDLGIDGVRCMGYYKDFNVADECVKVNNLDIQERIYNYAVIEKVEEGFYPMSLRRWFYKFDHEKGRFYEIGEPICVKHMINFSIG